MSTSTLSGKSPSDFVKKFRSDTDFQRESLARALDIARDNPAKYFEKLLKIETKKGTLEAFVPNQPQTAVINLVRALRRNNLPVRIVVLKARQVGMSTLGAALLFHATSLWPHRHSKLVAHDLETTDLLFSKSRLFYSKLPHDPMFRPKLEKSNRKEIIFAEPSHSRLSLTTAGNPNAGSGATIINLHMSELAKFERAQEVATSIMQTIPPPSVNNQTMVIMESTALGMGGYFHDMYVGSKEGKEQLVEDIHKHWDDVDKLEKIIKKYGQDPGFVPLFFPWHEFKEYEDPISKAGINHIRSTATPKEIELREKHGLSYGQLQFRRRKIAELAKRPDGTEPEALFQQEFPMNDQEAFLVTGNTFFSASAISKQTARPPEIAAEVDDPRIWDTAFRYNARTRPKLDPRPNGRLKIWDRPRVNAQYLIGGDVASAEAGEDFSVLQVINKRTCEQVATWHGKIGEDALARLSVLLGSWYNEADIAIENNNMGAATNMYLRDTLYPNFYTRRTYKANIDKSVDEYGWNTNMVTRPIILSEMHRHLREGSLRINDEQLIQECYVFRVNAKTGKPEAEEGKHDDRILSMAIALQVLSERPYQGKSPEALSSIINSSELDSMLVPTEDAADSMYGEIF